MPPRHRPALPRGPATATAYRPAPPIDKPRLLFGLGLVLIIGQLGLLIYLYQQPAPPWSLIPGQALTEYESP